ncbi:hypothetical protein M0R45_009312 [Rubus argutus]|uniref:Uncharacterized protein n=1 Tax=Rubus argutus TaxID=59490 RepID=A0AAW1Y365_RUBAR
MNVKENLSMSLSNVCGVNRLCHRNDIFHVFVRNTGTKAIKGIRLCLPELEEANSSWNCESLSKMFKLTFLELNNLIIYSGPKFLPDSLRNLIWSWYPSRFLPGSYRPNLLIELKMKNSKLVRLWDGKQDLPYLKSIDLRDSKNLTKTPDLTGIPNLERCERLQQLPDLPSNRVLEVRVDNCGSLKQLSEPSKLNKPINLEDFRLSSVNCFGLADDEGWNNTIFSMLRRMATQRISLKFDEFRIANSWR